VTVADAPEQWPVVSSTKLLDDWLISVRTDEVRMPDNQIAKRTVVTHPGAVAILGLDDDRRVLMIRQYRHPVGRLLWEIPAGLRDKDGESPLTAAQRELREETGYAAREWHTLVDYYSSPGFCTERIRIFLARGLFALRDRDYVPSDEEKYLVTEWVPLAEAVGQVLAGRLHNGVTVAGVMSGYAASAGGFGGLRAADAPES
jgi:8-oxo-dGDP phosphatase